MFLLSQGKSLKDLRNDWVIFDFHQLKTSADTKPLDTTEGKSVDLHPLSSPDCLLHEALFGNLSLFSLPNGDDSLMSANFLIYSLIV